jgi:hypothetical protein
VAPDRIFEHFIQSDVDRKKGFLPPAHEESPTAIHPAWWTGRSRKLNSETLSLSSRCRVLWAASSGGLNQLVPVTKITQRCTLEGERAGSYTRDLAPSLKAGIPDGMQRLVDAMEREFRATRA